MQVVWGHIPPPPGISLVLLSSCGGDSTDFMSGSPAVNSLRKWWGSNFHQGSGCAEGSLLLPTAPQCVGALVCAELTLGSAESRA